MKTQFLYKVLLLCSFLVSQNALALNQAREVEQQSKFISKEKLLSFIKKNEKFIKAIKVLGGIITITLIGGVTYKLIDKQPKPKLKNPDDDKELKLKNDEAQDSDAEEDDYESLNPENSGSDNSVPENIGEEGDNNNLIGQPANESEESPKEIVDEIIILPIKDAQDNQNQEIQPSSSSSTQNFEPAINAPENIVEPLEEKQVSDDKKPQEVSLSEDIQNDGWQFVDKSTVEDPAIKDNPPAAPTKEYLTEAEKNPEPQSKPEKQADENIQPEEESVSQNNNLNTSSLTLDTENVRTEEKTDDNNVSGFLAKDYADLDSLRKDAIKTFPKKIKEETFDGLYAKAKKELENLKKVNPSEYLKVMKLQQAQYLNKKNSPAKLAENPYNLVKFRILEILAPELSKESENI